MATIAEESIAPFHIDIPQSELDEVRDRLRRARWPREVGDNTDWQAGANLAYMRELVAYWIESYDWRVHERAMNGFAQFKTQIDGYPIHFIHERGKGPAPAPLVINHGWPWTFWDMRRIIGPLTDPAAHGGDPADAFDVVAPSLPGFAFSSPVTQPVTNFYTAADLWVTLMARLGYPRFGTQGGDIGAMVSAQLGHKYPERILGAHLHLLLPVRPPFPEAADYAPEELAFAARTQAFLAEGSGYMHIQRTRPQTLAFAMHDSPLGLAAWLIEKRRAWADTRGDLESVFSKDDLITTAMIYWLTETYVSSARHYYDGGRQDHVHDRLPFVEAPTGVLQFKGDVILQPRKWAERYYNLQRWNVAERGGHFAPMEAPELLVEDIRAFFRPLRTSFR
jgi:pimeloyl-ACP methyl ester carboxylesterase